MRLPLAALGLLAVVRTPAVAQQPPLDPPSVELPAELERVLRDYERAWRRGGAELAALFAEDGFVLARGRLPIRGRAAIAEYYDGGGPLALRAIAFEMSGSVAYILGGYSGAPDEPDDGKFTLTLHKGVDGRWLIFSDMDNSNRPIRAPPDDEILVATAALADFVGEPDSTEAIKLYERLEARTADIPDSAAWVTAIDGFGLQRTRYPDLVSRYWTANQHERRLGGALMVSGWRVELVERPTEFVADVIETVHYVSRVALSAGRDSAIVAVDAICGMLCGHGVLGLYVRRDEGWVLASTLQRLQY